ncbi:MAG: Fic family protein [Gammaproteobacteria bacterium]|nr:Fic family protein [Gammaproteobacteria bacterium]
MISFIPSSKLEKALKTLQGRLAEVSTGLANLSQAEQQYLNKCALISNVGASTRIENAVLTDVEIEWVDTTLSEDGTTTAFESKKAYLLDKLSSDRERSLEEVIGCRDVLHTIYEQAEELFPLTEMSLRGLHHDLLRHYPAANNYAGQYKKVENKVISTNHATGEQHTVLEPTSPGVMTDIAMQELINWYNSTLHEYHWPVLVAVEFIFRFLAIHPFQDGNGRLGRALFILALLQSKDSYLLTLTPYIAIDRHIEQHKATYYRVLHECSEGKFQTDPAQYRYEKLALFFLEMLNRAINDIELYRKRYGDLQKLSETALAVLNIFKASPERRLKIAEIEQGTTIPRRTIQYALKTLTDKQFIQKLGSGPGSRYQLVF